MGSRTYVDITLSPLQQPSFFLKLYTEAALSFAMLAYNLMSLFRQAVMRSRVKHTLSTLRGMVLAVGGAWKSGAGKNHLLLSVPRKKRAWFSGLWANASNLSCCKT